MYTPQNELESKSNEHHINNIKFYKLLKHIGFDRQKFNIVLSEFIENLLMRIVL